MSHMSTIFYFEFLTPLSKLTNATFWCTPHKIMGCLVTKLWPIYQNWKQNKTEEFDLFFCHYLKTIFLTSDSFPFIMSHMEFYTHTCLPSLKNLTSISTTLILLSRHTMMWFQCFFSLSALVCSSGPCSGPADFTSSGVSWISMSTCLFLSCESKQYWKWQIAKINKINNYT